MPVSNIIINGTFDAGDFGWSGVDLETSFPEGAYLSNGSTNAVSELDGNAGQTTIMEQSFEVLKPKVAKLTFRMALRKASTQNAGSEGFLVEVLDQNGNVIAADKFFPTTVDWVDVGLEVNFADAGKHTLRFTELGVDDALGAIIDDVSILVCFAKGTLIETDIGPRPVERLLRGDLVWTQDAGLTPVQWVGARRVTLAEQMADRRLRPVTIDAGALGNGLPTTALCLSQQHRVCMGGWRAELHFGTDEVLVPAIALVNGRDVRIDPPRGDVTYVHFLLDGHQIVRSGGLLTESFFPSALSLGGVDRAARAELAQIFPDLATLTRLYPRTARSVLRRHEARLVA
jgi:hypothetical protein